MEEKIAKMNAYFDAQIALCRQRGDALLSDDRTDEANFEKVRANVYDIFRTILSVARTRGDEAAVRAFFAEKLEQIPSNWHRAHENAVAHGDVVAQNLEAIKLDTLSGISTTFASIWEDAQ